MCGISQAVESSHHWSMFGAGLPNDALGTLLGFMDIISLIGIMIFGFGVGCLSLVWIVRLTGQKFGRY